MTCRELSAFIVDYLSGELDAETRRLFERHLTRCPSCAQYMVDYRRAIELGQRVYDDLDAPATDVPESLVLAILASRERDGPG